MNLVNTALVERSQLYKDRDYMYNAYVVERKSAAQIGAQLNIPQRTIGRWLHRLNIPVRTGNVGRNIITVSPYLKSLIEGELLGDGTMTKCGTHSAYYQHGSKYREYVEWLANEFAREGVKQGGEIDMRIHGGGYIKGRHVKKAAAYHYRSLAYVAFRSFRERFYPNEKKIVPRDLVLTPITARQWYIGDGSLLKPKNKSWRSAIVLWTCAFSRDDIEFLRDQLAELGFKTTYMKRERDNSIRIGAGSADSFLKWIGPCPIDCYAYKWDSNPGKSIGGNHGTSI